MDLLQSNIKNLSVIDLAYAVLVLLCDDKHIVECGVVWVFFELFWGWAKRNISTLKDVESTIADTLVSTKTIM